MWSKVVASTPRIPRRLGATGQQCLVKRWRHSLDCLWQWWIWNLHFNPPDLADDRTENEWLAAPSEGGPRAFGSHPQRSPQPRQSADSSEFGPRADEPG